MTPMPLRRFTIRSLMLTVAVAAIASGIFVKRFRPQPPEFYGYGFREPTELKESVIMDRAMPNALNAFTASRNPEAP